MIPKGAYWVRVNRFFGDAMMAYAAIEPLRRAALPLVFWGPARTVELFEGSAHVVATVAEPGRKYGIWEAARMLRGHRPAAVLGFPKSARPHLAALLARVPRRLGCGDGGVSLLLTHSVPFYSRDDHFVERYASTVTRAFPELGPLGFTPFRPRAQAFEARSAQAKEAAFEGDYVVLAPGANSGSKRLSLPLFAELGRRLEAMGRRVVILGAGAEDQRLAGELTAELPKALNLVDQCSLSLSAAWVCGARALVGMDSGLAHIAGGAGVPTLAVFGPTRPGHSRPWGPRVQVLRNESLSCLQCMAWHCPLADHPCMNAVPLGSLWEALLAGMAQSASGRA
ncbi:MAG: glycosyltransferase family 9 protein [Holophagaceae bacterium]|uniref:Glycosyltransferase family 9 protein n=1 Tax=Candidatus Geothrix skivensis TaxID=2954439 RepID=A0A9D7SG63_9BACT|nr:glycosyltransferase family 9 protein [Candidatus Geothrix skivensis]